MSAIERISRRRFSQLILIGTVGLAIEACQLAKKPAEAFVQVLIDSDTERAASFLAPDNRRNPMTSQFLTAASQQMAGCSIDASVERESLGIKSTNITFREPCGQSILGGEVSGVVVTQDRANGQDYINPFVIPVPYLGR